MILKKINNNATVGNNDDRSSEVEHPNSLFTETRPSQSCSSAVNMSGIDSSVDEQISKVYVGSSIENKRNEDRKHSEVVFLQSKVLTYHKISNFSPFIYINIDF